MDNQTPPSDEQLSLLKAFFERPRKRDGVLTFGRGERDIDDPFNDFVSGMIEWIDEMLDELGAPRASQGNWGNVKAQAANPVNGYPSQVYVHANLSGVAQRARLEHDQNRKLNRAFQLGWDAAMEKTGRVLGSDVLRGKNNAHATSRGGRQTRKNNYPAILKEIRQMRADRPSLSMRSISHILAKRFSCSPSTITRIERANRSNASDEP